MTTTRAVTRVLAVAPVILLVIALMPTVVLVPVLTESQGRRLVLFIRLLRAWHVRVMQPELSG